MGDKVLRAFGGGELSDTLATTEGDALPDWARTEAQKKKAAEQKAQEEERKRQEVEAQHLAEVQRQAAEAQRQAAETQRQQEQEAQRRTQEEIDRLAQLRLTELRREAEQLQRRT